MGPGRVMTPLHVKLRGMTEEGHLGWVSPIPKVLVCCQAAPLEVWSDGKTWCFQAAPLGWWSVVEDLVYQAGPLEVWIDVYKTSGLRPFHWGGGAPADVLE